MHYWLISIFEQTPLDKVTDTRFQCIAQELLRRGHTVTFFASTFKHNTKNQRFDNTKTVEIQPGYSMVYLKSQSYKKNISAKRMLAHYSFANNLVKTFNHYQLPEKILIAFPPVSLAYSVSKWGRSNNIPVYLDIIDPWPDIFRKPIGFLPKFIQDLLLYPMEAKLKSMLQNVTGVAAISNQYIDWVKKYCPQLSNTACFYPAVDFTSMQQQLSDASKNVTEKDASFYIIYAGSLASSYDIPTILSAAELLENKYGQQIKFIIAGTGPQSELIKVYENRHQNLSYLGRLTKSELMIQYGMADAGLTQHIKGASQSVTYKLFDLLACGLPIFNSLESEMKNIILDNEVGFFNEPGNGQQLADNIERIYLDKTLYKRFKQNAIDFTKQAGDSRVVYARMVDFFIND